jgi:hypothetical protein
VSVNHVIYDDECPCEDCWEETFLDVLEFLFGNSDEDDEQPWGMA